MPGQVIEEHAKFEEDCAKCHKRFDKSAQGRLCGDCHKAIRKDFEDKQRFHGRLTTQRECRACHTDHKGRKENIAPINESTFDHSRTNFPLNGAHADPKKADCKACHKPTVKYRDTPSDCQACHMKDDYHKGVFGARCETCHGEANWKTSSFDHDKDTKYPLQGKHKTTKCESCHTVPVAKGKTLTACYACHKKDDKHKNTLGRACETCHVEKSWKDTPSFNHDKTKFPLRGKHLETPCKDCHPDQRYKPTPVDCQACHKKDDYHKGVFGARCETCHGEANWKMSSFDHDKDTKYPLQGKHKTTKCESCHTVPVAKGKTLTACYACHKKDDVHKEALDRACGQCHTEKDWKDTRRFDHNKTSFPLSGKHRAVACKDCHADQRYKPTPLDCYSCHKKDDKHKGDYGEKCRTCHTDLIWKDIVFDHDRDTKYPLKGKHKTTKCDSCHKGPLYTQKTPTACHTCHQKDDVHKGLYGEQCADCHAEKKWKELLFDHDRHTKYPLKGKHAGVACKSCHQGHLYKQTTPTDCHACHQKDDKHEGQEGKQCEACHRELSWKVVKFDHDKSRFPLRGQHDLIDCKQCHKTLRFKDEPSSCFGCHQKDDVHKRRLSTTCESCHNARGWKLWDFDHNVRTKFVLDGAHTTLSCYDCHKIPMKEQAAAPASCIGCHRKDDKHDSGLGPQCDRCHTTVLWTALKPGSATRRP